MVDTYASSGDREVVLVGDLVNKGPKSIEVLDYVIQNNFQCVLGNHDQVALDFLEKRGKIRTDPWFLRLTEKHHEFLRGMPKIFRVPEYNAVVIHAGINPLKALKEQSDVDLTTIREVLVSGEGCDSYGKGSAWASLYRGEEGFIIFGHDARRGLQDYRNVTSSSSSSSNISNSYYCLGLDTGCVYGGQLTGYLLPEDKLVQIPAKEIYRKPE